MATDSAGAIKTSTVRRKRPNGDVYVYERKTQYDPNLKYTKSLGMTLKGKIPFGETEMVPTRPKRTSGGDIVPELTAVRKRVGMMEILAYAGEASGIDGALYRNTDRGTAAKIISLARYLVATDGETLPGIAVFQLTHPLPYAEGLSEDIYHDLFVEIGNNPSLEQSFFASRCRKLGADPTIAYDSTSITTYSKHQPNARSGVNKNGEHLPEIKFLLLYAAGTRQPIAFRKLAGNISDVVTIESALRQLEVLGIKHAELVTDRGYTSQENIAIICLAGFRFLTMVKTDCTFVSEAIDACVEQLENPDAIVPFAPGIRAATVMRMHGFKRHRKYANHAEGVKAGALQEIRRRVYIHVYFDGVERLEQDRAFDEKVRAVRDLLRSGVHTEDMEPATQKFAAKYLVVSTHRGKVKVEYNLAACQEKKRHHGYFVLLSNKRKDPFDSLETYRKRTLIELSFESHKDHNDGAKPRVWSDDALEGRMFVQFVALCYREYLAQQIRDVIQKLKQMERKEIPPKGRAEDRKKLLSWLEKNSLHHILQWFDVVECTNVSSAVRKKRWRSEITARDRLFLDMFGML